MTENLKDYCEQEGISHDDIINSEIEQEHNDCDVTRIFGESDRLYIKTLDEPDNLNGGVNHHFAICMQGTTVPMQIIKMQHGAISECGINGIQNVDLINIVIDNLQHFQNGKFSCRENAIALTHLETALLWLNKRTAERKARGVEGTNIV